MNDLKKIYQTYKSFLLEKNGTSIEDIEDDASKVIRKARFVNVEELQKKFFNLYKTELDDYKKDKEDEWILKELCSSGSFYFMFDDWDKDFDEYFPTSDDFAQTYAQYIAETTAQDIEEYVIRGEYIHSGNFAILDRNFERDNEGKNFNKILSELKSGIATNDTELFANWMVDWWFDRNGTWGYKYNFNSVIGDMIYNFKQDYYEDE